VVKTLNANLARTLRRTFYSLTRRYGQPGTLVKRAGTDVDFSTGNFTQTTVIHQIRNLVKLPSSTARQIIYTPSMMRSMRQFAWQGGQGTDTEETIFMIQIEDVRGWGKIESSQWIHCQQKNYEVVGADEYPGGWIIAAKRVEGPGDALELTLSDTGIVTQGASSDTV